MRTPLSRALGISFAPKYRTPTPFHLPPLVQRRSMQVSQSAETLDIPSPAPTSSSSEGVSPDAQFEVLGSPFSLLSVSLSASQTLFTRHGTVVGVGGNAENAVSTLSILEPFRRAFLRIPFLYQRISSTSPVTALISTKASSTSITTVNLDGRTDWMLAGRTLLAWTGQTISIKPSMNQKMSLAYWGTSEVTGRGLLALAGQGSISQIILKAGESYILHPSNLIAYSINRNPPLPYRLASSLSFQIPEINFTKLLPDTRFTRALRESYIWQTLTSILFRLRTWTRRTIWGDRLFLQFYGPTTILLQTRPSRLSDVLTSQDVHELADAQPGVVQPIVTLSEEKFEAQPSSHESTVMPVTIKAPRVSTVSIGSDGKVTFDSIEESRRST